MHYAVTVEKHVRNIRKEAQIELDNEIALATKPPTHPAIRKRYSNPNAPRVGAWLGNIVKRELQKTGYPSGVANAFSSAMNVIERLPAGFKIGDAYDQVPRDFFDLFVETSPGEFHINPRALMLALAEAGR